MGWRADEVWLEADVLWFREQPRIPFGGFSLSPALASDASAAAPSVPLPNGLDRSRRRRLEAQAARRRKHATRTVPAVALVLGSATMLPMYFTRQAGGREAGPLQDDPPSMTFRFDSALQTLEAPVPRTRAARSTSTSAPARRALATADATEATAAPTVAWGRAVSHGLQYGGSLSGGTQLPIEGPDWVTWNPNTDSVPNLPNRLYGHERTIRTILSVVAAYRAQHPDAPRVVIGDISLRHGGTMDQHASHQNGLDVDVYFPRADGWLQAPTATDQIDRALAQDILDRFVAAGAQVIFVGYHTGLRGPSGVVVPYPNHEDHMHIRFPNPG